MEEGGEDMEGGGGGHGGGTWRVGEGGGRHGKGGGTWRTTYTSYERVGWHGEKGELREGAGRSGMPWMPLHGAKGLS
jgi:hypothetical protein